MSTSLSLFIGLHLLLSFSFLLTSSSSEVEENPMQLLSEAELMRLAGYGDERLSSVLVTGSLFCEACLKPGSQLATSHVKGAKMAVACKTESLRRRRKYYANGTTDEFGEFIIDLPSKLHAIPKLEDACNVWVLRMPRNSLCFHLSAAGLNPRRITLSSVGNSIRLYTTGMWRLSLRGKPSNECFMRKTDHISMEMQSRV